LTRGDNRRLARVSEAVRVELARLLVKEINDPRLAWVTITGVEMSPDLRYARVYVTVSGADNFKLIEQSLKSAAPFLQRELNNRLKLRYTPRLSFFNDESIDRGERIDCLIREVRDEEDKRNKDESEALKLGRLVDKAESILLATHRNPDGDAIGSILGMAGILRLMCKEHIVYCPDGVPETLSFLPGADLLAGRLEQDANFDLTILFDTGDETLLPDGFPVEDIRGTLVVVDHHQQHRDFGDLVIRRDASSVGEILFDIGKELVWPMDSGVAECLYTSIVADTGSFRYSSTMPKTHLAAAELLEAGAKSWPVASRLFESFPLRRQRLLAKVLDTLVVSADGRFAYMFSNPKILEEAGATKQDLDGMINYGRSIDTVEIAAMFRIEPSGDIKVSFRSKGRADVGELAARFGGGGHRNAAGCTLHEMELAEARRAIMKEVEKFLDQCSKTELRSDPT
jgi:phosphoesterase RecJ-like protein